MGLPHASSRYCAFLLFRLSHHSSLSCSVSSMPPDPTQSHSCGPCTAHCSAQSRHLLLTFPPPPLLSWVAQGSLVLPHEEPFDCLGPCVSLPKARSAPLIAQCLPCPVTIREGEKTCSGHWLKVIVPLTIPVCTHGTCKCEHMHSGMHMDTHMESHV